MATSIIWMELDIISFDELDDFSRIEWSSRPKTSHNTLPLLVLSFER